MGTQRDTRTAIIDLADQLIRTRGYNAFSYADIAEAMDIRKPAIHYHFPTKSDLGISVINRELETLARSREQWAALPGDLQLGQLIASFFRSSRQRRICLTGSLTPEINSFTPAMQDRVGEMCRQILEWMTDCLEKGRAQQRLEFEGDAHDRALLVMASLSSALLLSRVLGAEVFDSMMNQLLMDMGAAFRVGDIDQHIN